MKGLLKAKEKRTVEVVQAPPLPTYDQAREVYEKARSSVIRDESNKMYQAAEQDAMKAFADQDALALRDLSIEIDNARHQTDKVIGELKAKCKTRRAAARSEYIKEEARARDLYYRAVE